jgi:hypothetical protein
MPKYSIYMLATTTTPAAAEARILLCREIEGSEEAEKVVENLSAGINGYSLPIPQLVHYLRELYGPLCFILYTKERTA